MIDFRAFTSEQEIINFLFAKVEGALKLRIRTLLLVPGGSWIPLLVSFADELATINTDTLTICQTDERYGLIGHTNSNWQQLLRAGFRSKDISCEPILGGGDMELTVQSFDARLRMLIDECSLKIGLFGLGVDGHTAGILPGSPAVYDKHHVAGYEAADFKRITMTSAAISRLDVGIVYAVGEAKWKAIANLSRDLPIEEQPAQCLKKIPELIIFNDSRGEKV